MCESSASLTAFPFWKKVTVNVQYFIVNASFFAKKSERSRSLQEWALSLNEERYQSVNDLHLQCDTLSFDMPVTSLLPKKRNTKTFPSFRVFVRVKHSKSREKIARNWHFSSCLQWKWRDWVGRRERFVALSTTDDDHDFGYWSFCCACRFVSIGCSFAFALQCFFNVCVMTSRWERERESESETTERQTESEKEEKKLLREKEGNYKRTTSQIYHLLNRKYFFPLLPLYLSTFAF